MSAPKRSSQHRGPGGRGMMAGDKAKDFRGTIVKLLHYLRPYTLQLTVIIVFAIASTIFSIIGPK
ncbi:MAG: ABC transporter ATP-binding protein, partial [Solobacterium sp.]|nr:ABC transporter ATP-binding protein [Solobacterium sp.]